jgi:antitoxin component YwqK of YwqJK toxin-antitoxin module
MRITGMETVDEIPMCKAIYETSNKDENISKLEYLWSQDGKTYIWIAYDITGKKISEVSMKDGKIEKIL